MQEVFGAALVAAPEEREELLDRACAADEELRREIDSLLRAYRSSSETTFLEDPVLDLRSADTDSAGGMPLPAQIDRYRLVSTLGAGGMGDVFLAFRSDDEFQKQVAVKLLRRDLGAQELVRRFRQERQILAHLEHPNIARLIDGGSTEDGRPYLVMELVDGEPIDEHCRRLGLSLAEKVALFEKVCGAVHFAHQNLVVHRDLKPANILVDTEGEPKLLDFGIAKLIGDSVGFVGAEATRTGQAAMTPDYASPEQIRGVEISTASDVYSLGVVLYQLLTGERPHRLTGLPADEVLQQVCGRGVKRPSSKVMAQTAEPGPSNRADRALVRGLRGDLDNIVMKAMAIEPGRRYSSAADLARDLERYRTGFPVIARPDTVIYRVGRFVRRNRLAVVLGCAALVGLLALTISLALQRSVTLRERDRATAVSDFLVEIFREADPTRTQGETITAREVLDQGRARIATLADRPRLQADLLETMGRVYDSLGLAESAAAVLRSSLEQREALHPGDHPEVAETLRLLGIAEYESANLAQAEALLARAVAMSSRLHGGDHPELAAAQLELATVYQRRARPEEARALYSEAVEIWRGTDRERDLAKALNALATVERELGLYDEAEAHHREAIARLRAESADGLDIELGWGLLNYGNLLRHRGDWTGAEGALREAGSLFDRLFSGAHPSRAAVANHLGLLMEDLDRQDEAEAEYRQALAMRRDIYGQQHTSVAQSLNNLALVVRKQGRLDEAQGLYEAALTVYRELLEDRHRDLAPVLSNLGELELARKRPELAEPYFEEALSIVLERFGSGHRRAAVLLNNLASCAMQRQDLDRAAELQVRAVESLREVLGPRHKDVAHMLYNLGVIYERAGRGAEATDAYRGASEAGADGLAPEHWLSQAIAEKLP